MKSLGKFDLDQNQLQNFALESVINYPAVPVVGQVIFKDKRVMLCIEISEGIPAWAPLTGELNTHIHDQSVAATTWTIDHTLNSSSCLVQVMGTDGKHLIPDDVTQTHNQTVITFTENQAGRAILMLGSEDGVPRADFAYEQEFTASSTWIVTHALGYNPAIRVFIGNQEVQPLSIVHDSTNQATVTFSTPQTGSIRAI
jgi:hypothetical protein